MAGYITKYLIESEGTIYTVSGGALQALEETGITASLFQTYGADTVPDGSLLLDLPGPSVMCWTDAEEAPVITASVRATPPPQTVISGAIDLTHSSIRGVEGATAACEGTLAMAVSVDGKETWQAHNGTEWLTLSGPGAGMSREQLEALTVDQWAGLVTDSATEMYIRVAFTDAAQSVSEIHVDFAN